MCLGYIVLRKPISSRMLADRSRATLQADELAIHVLHALRQKSNLKMPIGVLSASGSGPLWLESASFRNSAAQQLVQQRNGRRNSAATQQCNSATV